MTLHKVRHNDASCQLLGPHSPAFRAGQYSLRRQQNMAQARNLKKKSMGVSVKLFVDFARDDHHLYLHCLQEIRNELQAAMRIQNYESTVMDRVMGVFHR